MEAVDMETVSVSSAADPPQACTGEVGEKFKEACSTFIEKLLDTEREAKALRKDMQDLLHQLDLRIAIPTHPVIRVPVSTSSVTCCTSVSRLIKLHDANNREFLAHQTRGLTKLPKMSVQHCSQDVRPVARCEGSV